MNDSKSFQRASAAASRLLSHRPRSEAELRARLRGRFPADVVQRVMETLREGGLLDDAAFARLWKSSRDSLNPRSGAAIKRELIDKGIARDVAEAAVADSDDRDAAYRAALKWSRRLADADFPTFRRRLWGYLQRRRFSASISRQTIARLWEERQSADAAETGLEDQR